MGSSAVMSYSRATYTSETLKESNEKQGYVRFVSGFRLVSKRCKDVFTMLGACYFQDFYRLIHPDAKQRFW